MTVKLTINGRHYEFLVAKGDAKVPTISVHSQAWVEASISLSNDEEGGAFWLMMQGLPDVKTRVTVKTGEECLFFTADTYDSKFRLFRGCLGLGYLVLRTEIYNDEKTEHSQILAKVNVIDENKEKLFKEMRNELLSNQLPHFVINESSGQFKLDRFSLELKGGYASYEDNAVLLKEIRDSIKNIVPLLKLIALSPILHYETVSRRQPLSTVSHIDKINTKDIIRFSKDLGDMRKRDPHICTLRKRVTMRIPVHAAIRTFLDRFILRRLIIIQQEERERKKTLEVKIARLEVKPGIKSKRIGVEKIVECEGISKNLVLAEACEKEARRLLRMPIFEGLHEEISIYDLSPADFMVTDAYRNIYKIMAEFLRIRFWWVGDDVPPGRWRIPQLKLKRDGQDILQEKYSIVYENWCYAQIIISLQRLGYVYLKNGKLKYSTCGDCVLEKKSENGMIRVTVVHDVKPEVPWKTTSDSTPGFYSGNGGTPDFALIVSRDWEDGFSWYLLDAKSDESGIKPHMVKTLINYGGKEFTYKGVQKLGVFLLRSGDNENDGNNAKIEIPPPVPQVKVEDKDPEQISWWFSSNYSWNNGKEIRNEGRKIPYIGYLRVNVLSKNRNNVFDEFLNGLVNTPASSLTVMQ